RLGVIRRGPVEPVPEGVARAGRRRADVRVAVVAVDAPGVEDALEIDELVAGAPQVIHDLGRPLLDQRLAGAPRDGGEGLLPGDALPLPLAARPRPAEGIEDALGIRHLVERGGALGAVAAAAAGMRGVALEFLDLEGALVHVGEQPAGGLAVEADRRDERVLPLHPPRPRARVELLPVVPECGGRGAGETPPRPREGPGGRGGRAPRAGAWRSRATGWSGSVTRSVMVSASAQRHGLARAYPEILVEPEPREGEHGRRPPRGVPRREEERDGQRDPRPHHTTPQRHSEW